MDSRSEVTCSVLSTNWRVRGQTGFLPYTEGPCILVREDIERRILEPVVRKSRQK